MAAPKSPGFAKKPDYRVDLVASPRRVRVMFAGHTIADTTGTVLMRETGHVPVYYFPVDDIDSAVCVPSSHTSFCPFKGTASYWTVRAGGRAAENAMWRYPEPYAEVPGLAGLASFYWSKMDHWYEEDEEIFVHPRDPYKRIDVVESHRPVRVVIDGETVAETTRARFLFETGLPTRYYIPPEDVRMDLLVASVTTSRCPYKGIARYWSARIDGRETADIAWSYPDPIAECPRLRDLVCFYNEVVDDIFVDGRPVLKVRTPWSRD
jgi:uncharacterized protein (DUF427 family)